MDHTTCGSGARWCARADAIFDVPDMHVLEVDDVRRLVLTVESGQLEAACPTCGVLAVSHGRLWRRLGWRWRYGRLVGRPDALNYDDTTVSALARHLGVDWHTCWDAIEVEARARTSNSARLQGVKTLAWTSTLCAMRRWCAVRRWESREVQDLLAGLSQQPGGS
jgi:transposase